MRERRGKIYSYYQSSTSVCVSLCIRSQRRTRIERSRFMEIISNFLPSPEYESPEVMTNLRLSVVSSDDFSPSFVYDFPYCLCLDISFLLSSFFSAKNNHSINSTPVQRQNCSFVSCVFAFTFNHEQWTKIMMQEVQLKRRRRLRYMFLSSLLYLTRKINVFTYLRSLLLLSSKKFF